jgi:hypothetical protein
MDKPVPLIERFLNTIGLIIDDPTFAMDSSAAKVIKQIECSRKRALVNCQIFVLNETPSLLIIFFTL